MKIKRILILEQLLKQGPESIESLSEKLKGRGIKCSNRTIYRDLIILEECYEDIRMGLKVIDGEFNRKKWIICDKKAIASEDSEIYFKTFLQDQFKPNWLKSITGNSIDTLVKLNYTIPNGEYKTLITHIPDESIICTDWNEFTINAHSLKHIKDVLWAITNRKQILIEYYYQGKRIKSKCNPFRLVYHRGTIHIACWILDDNTGKSEFCVRELDTLEKISMSNNRYNIKDKKKTANKELTSRFGIHDSDDKKIYSIKLEMGEGPYIFLSRRFWHTSQKFHRSAEGKYFMELKCRINIELIGWLFSWVEHIKIHSPDILKNNMRQRAEFIALLYTKNNGPINPSNSNNAMVIGK